MAKNTNNIELTNLSEVWENINIDFGIPETNWEEVEIFDFDIPDFDFEIPEIDFNIPDFEL